MTQHTHSVIGVDLGGTKIAIARYDLSSWQLQEEKRIPTHALQHFEHVADDMMRLIQKVQTHDTKAVGVGVPGLITKTNGRIVTMPNITGSEGYPLKEELERRLHIPVFIDNDANCFTLAEALHGAGKGEDVVVGITMGTGVGGGIAIDGKLFHGHAGYAGEVGHMLLRPGEPPYTTDDRRGDVEQFLSGTSMGRRCSEAKRPEEYLEGEVCAFLQPQVFREVAWVCVNLIHLLDPSIIVFGGSAGRALGPHLEDVRTETRKWSLPGTPLPRFALATLMDSGTRGAALLTQ